VTGSTHQRSFTQTFGVPDQGTNGILPNMILSQSWIIRFRPYRPVVRQQGQHPVVAGQGSHAAAEQNCRLVDTARSGQYRSGSLLQRPVGSHLQAQLLNVDQVDPKYLTQYGSTLLNSL
jgi:hypothetical protein